MIVGLFMVMKVRARVRRMLARRVLVCSEDGSGRRIAAQRERLRG